MKKIISLGAFLFIVVIAYTAVWFWAAWQASAYVRTLETADGVSTPRVVCEDFRISGYPFGFDATCRGATIQTGDLTITAGVVQAAAEVYRPTHVIAFAESPVTFDDAFTGSRSRLDFDSAQASARLDGWRIGRVSVVVDAPAWTETLIGDRLLAQASRLEAHLLDMPEQHDAEAGLASLAQYVAVEGVNAPGADIADGRATFEAEITNLPDDVRLYGDADLLRRWQAANGRFNLVGLRGDDGGNFFTATGHLALDSAGRPEGQLQLSSRGVVERLGPMFPEQYRQWILGTQAADGSYSQTLNIAAGMVFSGLVPTGVIPPLF